MKDSFDSLNDTFNTEPIEVEAITAPEKKSTSKDAITKVNDVEKDYTYTRGQLYSLIEKGQEAINGIMEVAGESASPRAYEVAGQLLSLIHI